MGSPEAEMETRQMFTFMRSCSRNVHRLAILRVRKYPLRVELRNAFLIRITYTLPRYRTPSVLSCVCLLRNREKRGRIQWRR